ncbi:hypothetical protein WJX81_002293 [Elliptochloris bilobata]|uniref:FAD-binding PCMH-type domain-containing protein n=1 Tax=Elliptochloris bilobata TaxID=381761 RepID=A0AAW1R368_9CHLO
MDSAHLATWHLAHKTRPAKIVLPKDVEEVVAAVRDPKNHPSPLIAVGAMHSVTRCVEADAGTVVCMAGFNRVIGMAGATDSPCQVVRVEAGVTLAVLHAWLLALQRELSFSPEIGDATVGGLVTTMCKDSSVRGPGHLCALVEALTYVDHEGNVVGLSRQEDEVALEHYMCSYCTQGITLDAMLRCRPACLVRTRVRALPTGDGARLAERILRMRAQCDNMWAVITLHGCCLEQRWQLPGRALHRQSPRLLLEVFRRVRYQTFLVPHTPAYILLGARLPLPGLVHHRSLLVNSYPAVTAEQSRLDFSYYEYPDIGRFAEVVEGVLQFARDHKDATGFAPAGFALYFVRRGGARARMHAGAYSGGEGWSFVLDPTCGQPTDPRWLEFCRAFTPWALAHGARTSPTQTKELLPGQYALDSRYVRARFLTPYFAQFVTELKQGAETPAFDTLPKT